MVAALCVTETVTWGMIYYGYPLFLLPMEEALAHQLIDHARRLVPELEQLERHVAESRIGDGHDRDGAEPRPRVADSRAHGERARGGAEAEPARSRAARSR